MLAAVVSAQEPVVDRAAIFLATVKRGDMPVAVSGRGVLGANNTAEIQLAIALAKQVQPGQAVSLNVRNVRGQVTRVGPAVTDGMVPLRVDLQGMLPESARPGDAVEGAVHITTLNDVVFVERPVGIQPDSDGTVFKLDPDGLSARRVRVRYGQYGKAPGSVVHIHSGLAPGDQVILSDMSGYAGREKVRVQ